MNLIKFSNRFIETYPDVYKYVEQNLISYIVEYIINSKKRQSVELSTWLKEQVNNPNEALNEIANSIKTCQNKDDQVMEVFNYVKANLIYETDTDKWQIQEHWNMVLETINDMRGDCEDGAILIYVLCRLKGINANRLIIWAGDTQYTNLSQINGHCCCFYKPNNYPLNFVNLDWCYLPNLNAVKDRTIFSFIGKDISEFRIKYGIDPINWSIYKNTWFMFNEDIGFTSYLQKEINY